MISAGRAWRRYGVAEVPPTVMPEPGHARPAAIVSHGAGARRAPASAAAARVGLMGAGRSPGAERLPVGGDRGVAAVVALPRLAPAPARIARTWWRWS